jgi:flagellar M-ring protein FliF
VGVIVPQLLNDDQLKRIRDIVGMAVGFSAERGDAITVEPLSRIMTKPTSEAAPIVSQPAAVEPAPKAERWTGINATTVVSAVIVLVLVMLVVVITLRRAERNTLERRLSASERRQLLTELKSWIDAEKATEGGAAKG